ncbi:MAG: aminotransferase class IV, partial [Halobacteria archaeon]|nr:aminotransferase class IV [Halobacteria archaeon]
MTSRSDIGDETVALVSEEPEEESSFEVVGADEAGISVLDRGFLYGDAVFETLRCYGSEPAFLGEHVDLLNSSLERLGFGIEVETSEARLWVEEMLAQLPDATDGDHDDAYVRLCVTRGRRSGLLEPTEARPTLVCIAKGLIRRRYPSASCEVVGTRRPRGVVGELKTHNYLPNVLAKSEAGDVDEALMRNSEGEIASGAVSNLFVLRDGVLRTSRRE